jgi:predicted transcriptional regulator
MSDTWSFLTNHARALLFIAHDPNSRLREVAAEIGVTERTAHSIVTDLAQAGYVAKERQGRRNIYHVQDHIPVRDAVGRQRAIGELLRLFLPNP